MEQQEIYTVGNVKVTPIPDPTLEAELRTIQNAFGARDLAIGVNLLLASIARSLARIEAQGRQGGY